MLCICSAPGSGDHGEQNKILALVQFSWLSQIDVARPHPDLRHPPVGLTDGVWPPLRPCPIFNPSVAFPTGAGPRPSHLAPMNSVMGGSSPFRRPLPSCLSVPSQLILHVGLSSVLPQLPPGVQACHLPSSRDMRGGTPALFLSPRNIPGEGPEENFICSSAQLSPVGWMGPRPRLWPLLPLLTGTI